MKTQTQTQTETEAIFYHVHGGGGGGLPQCMLGCQHHPPPRSRHPPGSRHPTWSRHPPSRRLLLRMVRILLECILVVYVFLLNFVDDSPFWRH